MNDLNKGLRQPNCSVAEDIPLEQLMFYAKDILLINQDLPMAKTFQGIPFGYH